MHYYPGTAYMHCRSGSDTGLDRRNFRKEQDVLDSGDSTLSDLEESESGSGSGIDVDPNLPYPGIAPIALRYLSQTTRPRNWCLALISNPWFERISMMVILLNCVTLGMYQPCMDDQCETNRCKILQLFDDFIFAFFALEMAIKMIAMGVYGHGSYLADSWNRLDLFIVFAGAIEYGLHVDNLNLSAVRTIRVLRPLRAINRIPSMRILVMLLLDTLPMLGNVLLLCFFVFFIFGIVGVQLWQGILRQRCYLPSNLNHTYNYTLPDISRFYKLQQDQEYICSKRDHSGLHVCGDLPPFINGSTVCNLTIEQKFSTKNLLNDSVCVNWNRYYTYCYEGGKNPFQGTISFDNIGLAWVSIFLVISLEGWTDIMYFVQDAHSFWDWIYFVLLIVIGSFFMINLCLVVIATQFSETKKREMERMRLERARFQSSSTLASSTNNSEPTSCYAEIVKYIAHLWRRGKRRLFKKIRLYRVRREQRRDRKMAVAETIRLNYNKRHHPNCTRMLRSTISQPIDPTTMSRTSSICLSESQHHERPSSRLRVLTTAHSNTDIGQSNDNLLTPSLATTRRRSSVMFSDVIVLHGSTSGPDSTTTTATNTNPPTDMIDKKNICSSEKTTQAGDGNIWQTANSKTDQQQIDQTRKRIADDCCKLLGETMTCQELLALGAINAALPTGQIVLDTFFTTLSKGGKETNDDNDFSCCQDLWLVDEDLDEPVNRKRSKIYVCICTCVKCCLRGVQAFRRVVRCLVEHRYFQQGILLAILINTLSMGIEYHEQPEYLTHAVETSNIIFSAIFAVEMVLKIIAEGPFGYISNGFNVFDGVIVVLSGVELFQKFMGESQTDSGLSVLRTFRLLRILKLVRFMPNLRRQLFVMLRTMDNVAIFFSLLILFIFIFSILGMYLFGGKFCNYKDYDGNIKECTCEMIITNDVRCECDRKHFNNILWATVTVFQILTQEDWNMVLSNGMAKTSHWAALYFVALMTFGNYVLFNLLVAILVEGFSSERNERREREQRELARRKMSCMLEMSLKGNGSSDDSSNRSESSRDSKNRWKSADELPKIKEWNKRTLGCSNCNKSNVELEPKCNIQKESLQKQVITPVITHTAATPQDSPSITLDDFPEFTYTLTNEPGSDSASAASESTAKSQSLGLLKPPSLTPPALVFRQFERFPSDEIRPSSSVTLAGKILTHNERIGSKTMTVSEKIPPLKMQRRCSWKSSLRRKKKTGDSADSEEQPLNNGRDHSHCNGGGTNIKNDPLLQSSIRIQNDTQKDAPNNKSGSRQNNSSVKIIRCGSNLALEPKSINNLNEKKLQANEKILPKIGLDERIGAGEPPQPPPIASHPSPRNTSLKKLMLMLEPTGCLKARDEYSLYVFAPDNTFRKFCHWLVTQKWFDNVILLFIAMNCITLAMERPNIPPTSTERFFLMTCNYIFTVVFTVEMFVKVVAAGMCYGPNAYFTSGWNIMDGSLVIISIVDLLMSLISESSPKIFGILRVFRLLRSLRPLRVINRAPGLKLVVQTLLSSLRPIGNIVLICCTFFIIFGILGVQLFKGSFHYCVGENLTGIINRSDCEQRHYHWENQKYNFDDLGQALMSLFVLSSRDGWVNIMYDGLDAVGVDQQPITNYSEWRLLYFISFILLVGFFVLNMFVGVVVENFHRCREEQEKEERVRRAAKRALQMEKRRRKMNEPPYYINYAPWRLFIHNVVTSKYFDLAIAAVIGLNVVTMATESYKMPEILSYVLKIFNYFFTAVFIIESTMKLIALGLVLYMKDKWNQLDVAIVLLSVIGIVLEELKSNIIPINPTVLRVMRVMRIARVLKLLKMAKGIRALLDTVMQALPQVGNLGLLFFLLFFIFAALGVELFGRLDCRKHPCQGLGEHAHFENFGMAFLTLFRVATGDNWNGIMKDTLRDENCDKSADCVTNCCVSKIIAPIFFVIFVLMAQFVLVNVVVAVLMKHLEESHKHLEDEQDMDNQLEREFQEKQEMEERRELCLALQLDQECQMEQKPKLTKVLSLPSNFTYHPPGTKTEPPSFGRHSARRQTLHSHQPIPLLNIDDIRNIDESLTDIYSIEECGHLAGYEKDLPDPCDNLLKSDEGCRYLNVPTEKNKYYASGGSNTARGCANNQFLGNLGAEEETSFLLTRSSLRGSQESVQRIITERRKLDENLREFDEQDIFSVQNDSEEKLMENDNVG